MNKIKKAFRVYVSGKGEFYRLAESAALCRKLLCTEIYIDQTDIELCCRCPELDQYSQYELTDRKVLEKLVD
ncbi:hypothetical protein [Morganella psychrotolerans]|uniref:hypothetical protein n=1 Tax=Morganella psychrotolerans TaxID=368603 RepID=UPI0039B01DFD